MKRHYLALLGAWVLLNVSDALAQNSSLTKSASNAVIEYLSPSDGDNFVQTRTTLIIRPSNKFTTTYGLTDIQFSVTASRSGKHDGKTVVSDDGRTIIFSPKNPFSPGESVDVTLSSFRSETFPPIHYGFHISTMTEDERENALQRIARQERQWDAGLQSNGKSDDQTQECIPEDSIPIHIVVDSVNNPTPGNVFFSAADLFMGKYSFISILNNVGNIAYLQNIPKGCENFKVLPDNTFSYFAQTGNGKSGLPTGIIKRIDNQGNLLETYQCGNGYTTDYHDFWLLPDDHALVVSFDPEYVDMTKIISDSGAKTNAVVTGAIIQELDRSKNVIFQWRSWDHTLITDATHENLVAPYVDYVHLNTAFIDTDGNIIASLRHQDRVIKISRKDGNTIWNWGGKHNQFAFIGDTLTFSHQHNPARISNGHITLWDNGNFHWVHLNGKDTVIPSSRAVEFDLDEKNLTATPVWEYRNVPFSPAGGNVQRLDNGNTFICLGLNTFPEAIEITPEGKRLFQFSIQYGAWCYRAYKFQQIVITPANSVSNTGSVKYGINSIYPNPATASTVVTISAESEGMAQLDLINAMGTTMRSVRQSISSSGASPITLDVHNLPSGTYYCRLKAGAVNDEKTIVVQK